MRGGGGRGYGRRTAPKDFDKLHTKRVTKAQFERGLHMAQVNLTDTEVGQLADHYKRADGFVNYGEFCDQIDKIFTEKNLERSPKKIPRRFSKEVRARKAHIAHSVFCQCVLAACFGRVL